MPDEKLGELYPTHWNRKVHVATHRILRDLTHTYLAGDFCISRSAPPNSREPAR